MGGQGLLLLIGLKLLIIMTLLQNIISDAQGLLMLMESKLSLSLICSELYQSFLPAVAIMYTLITDTYTIATTKIMHQIHVSLDINTQNKTQKNKIGIIGNNMRIK